MPELPEVQTVVSDLKSKILQQKIINVQVLFSKIFVLEPAQIINQTIIDVLRRGKYILIKLSNGYLVVHLRMTGRFFVASKKSSKIILTPEQQKHLHVLIELQDYLLLFQDQRKFGRMHFYQNLAWLESKLGPEPLSPDFTISYLSQICKSNRQIKALLLDQSKIAGLGNIYVDEVLWQVGVHPNTPACNIVFTKLKIMHTAIQNILQQAIAMQGTTFLSYAFDGAQKGKFLTYLKVFNRAKLPCFRCGTTIIKIKVVQRGTHLCPACQPLDPLDFRKKISLNTGRAKQVKKN